MTTDDRPAHFRFPLEHGGELELNGYDELKFWHSPAVASGRALSVPDMMRLRSALGDRLIEDALAREPAVSTPPVPPSMRDVHDNGCAYVQGLRRGEPNVACGCGVEPAVASGAPSGPSVTAAVEDGDGGAPPGEVRQKAGPALVDDPIRWLDPRVEAVCAVRYDRWGDDERRVMAEWLAVADAVDPHRQPIPGHGRAPAPLDMVHAALYGDSWARPEPPGKVWAALLEVVAEFAAVNIVRGIAP